MLVDAVIWIGYYAYLLHDSFNNCKCLPQISTLDGDSWCRYVIILPLHSDPLNSLLIFLKSWLKFSYISSNFHKKTILHHGPVLLRKAMVQSIAVAKPFNEQGWGHLGWHILSMNRGGAICRCHPLGGIIMHSHSPSLASHLVIRLKQKQGKTPLNRQAFSSRGSWEIDAQYKSIVIDQTVSIPNASMYDSSQEWTSGKEKEEMA